MSALLLHGFTGTPESFADATRAFSDRDRIVPPLGGHLDAPAPIDFWSEVERLAALAPEARTLIGYSLGGRLALGILARFGARFERALLIGAHPGLGDESARRERDRSDAALAELLRTRGLEHFVSVWERLPLWASQRELPASLLERQRRERLRHDPAGLAACLERLGLGRMPDLRPLLGRVTTRVTLLVGERDHKFVELARELCGIIPGARLSLAAGAGHNVLLERPESVAAWLSEGT